MFRREVDIWFGFSHPHLIKLFGACHVGRPFFVCEYATNGTLVSYLRKYPEQLWPKLLEAALGVQYLHARRVVHGDLKGNNIVIVSDRKAKVTDFGLSSFASNEAKPQVSAAWHWMAPECMPRTGTATQENEIVGPTFASDVYSLGMCIVEALRVVEAVASGKDSTYCLPWCVREIAVVKYHAQHGELPARPAVCEDNQWELIERVCTLEPQNRIKISTVVDELARLANSQDNSLADTSLTPSAKLESASEVIANAQLLLARLEDEMRFGSRLTSRLLVGSPQVSAPTSWRQSK
ncbi:Serine/threonine-protein kinase tnni3k [Phytophthora pseudosyringae]|uniref:Serine/threonine-protein kinase tnni3k n=1 Tax=Phytophthora pseudosyringae TaxID=221518 RepID=A0A8T1VFM4_9STRA|nr:Serine/threonine-protein kinase tnni3k [Phytophthora pseudosyringae]